MPPPQPRIATTHELMMPYAADLLRQKAKGASHGQMISWLHTQGVMVNMGEIASFWPYLALQKQKEQQAQSGQPKPEQEPQTQQPGGTPTLSRINPVHPVHPVHPVEKSEFTSSCEPVLLAYVFDLISLRAAGKSDDELLAWLQTNKMLGTSHSELTKVFDYYQEYQEEIEEELQQAWESHLARDHGQPSRPEKDQGENGNPPKNASGGVTAGNAEKPHQQNEEKCLPMASGGLTASAEYDISEVMADYKILVAKQVRRDKLAPEPNLESQKITERMVRTLMMYKNSLERKEERKAALELKKAGHELNVKKAAASADRVVAKAKSGQAKGFPKDFDNTEKIKAMRHEMFKDEFTPERLAEVDRMIVECDKKALAAGLKFVPYVPPAPSPNDPWHPNNPS